MSYAHGMMAIRLQAPPVIPRTEYCSHRAFTLRVTGIDPEDPERGHLCGPELARLLDYGLIWSVFEYPFRGRRTNMGHASWYDREWRPDERFCPFKSEEDVLNFDPAAEFGIASYAEMTAYFERAYQNSQAAYPHSVFTGGRYHTLISACIDAFGWEMFLSALGSDPKRFERVLDGFFERSMADIRAQARTSIPAFICHDDMVWSSGAIFHPDWYRRNVFPRFRKLWEPLHEAGIPVLFCSDGNFTEFVDDLAEAGADGFIFEPLTDLEYICKRYGKTKVIIGNADCRILTFGDREDIRREVERCFNLGRNCPGFMMATGNHIPPNIPLDNIMYYDEIVQKMRMKR
ncbi:MAG TPA: uroporphyrinogen decarboxylase family protein [Candidatus Brocadiia bacterium]|nr:uroporphyrinogen decarboxylase family protein [Candidatus Brocadiia bacterium]